MKVARFVLKCVALGLTVATAACLLIAYCLLYTSDAADEL